MKCRIEKNKNFKAIHTLPLKDKNLSYKARGILAFILTLPDNWKGHIYHLVNCSEKDGSASVQSAIKELVTNRYAKLLTEKNEHGRYIGKYYVFFDHKKNEKEYASI